MRNIVDQYRPDVSFWDVVPEFKTIEPTMELYNSDRSVNKKNSSITMWAIALLIDPKSIFFNLPNKKEVLARDHLKNENFDWDSIDNLIKLYSDCQLTQAEKSLIAWDEMMKRRDTFIKSQDYSLDSYQLDEEGGNILIRNKPVIIKGTADQLDKMASNTAKYYADYAKVKKDLEEEYIKRGRGNKVISLSDNNEI
jgi:hypothetical protein